MMKHVTEYASERYENIDCYYRLKGKKHGFRNAECNINVQK